MILPFFPALTSGHMAELRVPRIADCMSRDRFHDIKSHLSLESAEEDGPPVPPTSPAFDRCKKVRPALDLLSANSKRFVKVGRNVSVDEMMVLCKGALA